MVHLKAWNKDFDYETINCGEVDLVLNAGFIMDYNAACWGYLKGQWSNEVPLCYALTAIENEASHA